MCPHPIFSGVRQEEDGRHCGNSNNSVAQFTTREAIEKVYEIPDSCWPREYPPTVRKIRVTECTVAKLHGKN